MRIKLVIFLFGLTIFVEGQDFGQGQDFSNNNNNNNNNCASQFVNFAQCLRDQQRQGMENAGLSKPSQQEQQDLTNNVRNCFGKFGCSDPLPSDSENQARLDCFRQSQAKLRSDLQDCVKKDFSDFSLPEDNFGNGDPWNIFLLSVNDAVHNYKTYCQRSTSQRDLRVCVEQALGDFSNRHSSNPNSNSNSNRNPSWRDPNFRSGNSGNPNPNPNARNRSGQPRRSRNYCEMRAQCMNNNNGMSQSCESDWRTRVMPQLCTCGQNLKSAGRVRAYEADFLNCMNSKGARANATNDPAFKWLSNGLGGWCSKGINQQSNTDPCSGTSGNQRPPNWGGNGGNSGSGGSGGNGGNGGSFGGSFTSTTRGFFNGFQSSSPSTVFLWNGNGNGDGNGGNGNGNGNGNGDSSALPPWNPNPDSDSSFTTQPQNQNGFFGTQNGGQPIDQQPNQQQQGGFGNLFGNGGGGFGNLFGGNAGAAAAPGGGSGDLFGGMLNNLGIGSPFDSGGIFGSLAGGFGQIFQNLLGGFGR